MKERRDRKAADEITSTPRYQKLLARFPFLLFILFLSARAQAAAPQASSSAPAAAKPSESEEGLLAPDVSLIDAPTSSVLDYMGYQSQSRFFGSGGLLQYFSFGVYPGVDIGASLALDGLIGNQSPVYVRAPNAQVKWRFYDGDRYIPSLAAGYDGQGYDYNGLLSRYNERQRGAYVVASQELGVPGLMLHPSFNISDFNSGSLFGSLPLSYNFRDKVMLMAEWDNIHNFGDSRFNSGVRFFITPRFRLDFAVRAIGQGGRFSNGDFRGPERIVQIWYGASL